MSKTLVKSEDAADSSGEACKHETERAKCSAQPPAMCSSHCFNCCRWLTVSTHPLPHPTRLSVQAPRPPASVSSSPAESWNLRPYPLDCEIDLTIGTLNSARISTLNPQSNRTKGTLPINIIVVLPGVPRNTNYSDHAPRPSADRLTRTRSELKNDGCIDCKNAAAPATHWVLSSMKVARMR